jgi:hypothetical protein
MNTEVTKNTTFEERMFEQMREQMGTLLTEVELKAILETSIQKAFFSDRPSDDQYSRHKKEPLFVEMMRKELTPMLEAGAKQWLADNQDKVGEMLQKQLGNSAAEMVANAFSSLMSEPMQQFSFALQSKLSEQGIHL